MGRTYLCRDGLSNRHLVDLLQFSWRTRGFDTPHYFSEQSGFAQVRDVVPTVTPCIRTLGRGPLRVLFGYRFCLRLRHRIGVGMRSIGIA
jgi:hypothetical protein